MSIRGAVPSLWLFTEHRNATCFINFDYPLAPLVQSGQIKLHSWSSAELTGRDWPLIVAELEQRLATERPAAVILSRFVKPCGREVLDWCAAQGLPSFFHLDDLLFELPADLGANYVAAYDDTYRSALHDCLNHAGTVLASTPVLAAALKARLPGQSIQTVPGVCYLPGLVQRWQPLRVLRRLRHRLPHRWARTKRDPVIGYMGSSSHARDLATITPQLLDLLQRHPRLRFETLGLPMPPELLALGPARVRAYGYTRSYAEFLGRLYELGWDIGLAPLADDLFNRSKTVTKFIEYTSCAIPVIAASISPYSDLAHASKGLAVAGPGQWGLVIQQWLAQPELSHRALIEAQSYCEINYRGEVVGRMFIDRVIGADWSYLSVLN